MKLVRYGAEGSEKPALVDSEGQLRDLSAHISDIAGDMLDDGTLDNLRSL
ncbi:MAG: 2-hydroxyhepta-2,4-diene-1,7-dioate isomerase, partial [Roseibium sp.]